MVDDREEIVLVTNDRWMREGGLKCDADEELLSQASNNGELQVTMVDVAGMLKMMKLEDPDKYEEFKRHTEIREGHVIESDEELVKISRMANERKVEFDVIVIDMDADTATKIYKWRVRSHMTWRSIANTAYMSGMFDSKWSPPSNQLMGMALCDKAASIFNENYEEGEWN